MIYFSPKLLVSGLSGVGLVAGGLAAWRLTEGNEPVTQTSITSNLKPKPKSYQGDLDEICGTNVWTDNSIDATQKNSKSKNLREWTECNEEITKKHYPESMKK